MNEIQLLLNVSSGCFFAGAIFGMIRKWRAKDKMQSTSFEGTLLNVTAGFLAAIASYLLGAWFSVGFEFALCVMNAMALYWKFRWMRDKRRSRGFKMTFRRKNH